MSACIAMAGSAARSSADRAGRPIGRPGKLTPFSSRSFSPLGRAPTTSNILSVPSSATTRQRILPSSIQTRESIGRRATTSGKLAVRTASPPEIASRGATARQIRSPSRTRFGLAGESVSTRHFGPGRSIKMRQSRPSFIAALRTCAAIAAHAFASSCAQFIRAQSAPAATRLSTNPMSVAASLARSPSPRWSPCFGRKEPLVACRVAVRLRPKDSPRERSPPWRRRYSKGRQSRRRDLPSRDPRSDRGKKDPAPTASAATPRYRGFAMPDSARGCPPMDESRRGR